jgi:RimJ/RimL family protein N-acetyltransferase
MTLGGSIVLRVATLDDVQSLFLWRNHPTTRAASHSTAKIPFDEHLNWLKRSLANSNRRLLIAERAGVPVGSVRADFADGVWELSWIVAPDERGVGIGKAMVAAVAQSIVDPVRAEVRTGNLASVHIALHAGMHFVGESHGVLNFKRKAVSPVRTFNGTV